MRNGKNKNKDTWYNRIMSTKTKPHTLWILGNCIYCGNGNLKMIKYRTLSDNKGKKIIFKIVEILILLKHELSLSWFVNWPYSTCNPSKLSQSDLHPRRVKLDSTVINRLSLALLTNGDSSYCHYAAFPCHWLLLMVFAALIPLVSNNHTTRSSLFIVKILKILRHTSTNPHLVSKPTVILI